MFCKENEAKNTFLPAVGKGIGPAMLPMEQWSIKDGEKTGANWRYRLTATGKGRHLVFDTNFWKSRIGERLISPKGNTNALLLWGDERTDHKLLCDHLSSEYPTTTFGRGRSVDVWNAHASAPDNHWFDCLIMSAVAASMCGLELDDSGSGSTLKEKKARRVVNKEMFAKK